MNECSKPGCAKRAFMDPDRCFDHQKLPTGFRIWLAICALVTVAVITAALWVATPS